jgi:PTH1 family peptidyl-tRNA hydrolase
MTRSIIFLGNPGRQYQRTRHNAGWMLCDSFLDKHGETPDWRTKFHSLYWESFTLFPEKTILCRPQTFMNRSGMSVRELSSFFRLTGDDIIVAHDDLETPFGTVTFRFGGGHGGHNGIRSIIQELGTGDFFRLRIGIGRPIRQSVSSFVLGRFSPDEEISLPHIMRAGTDLLDSRLRMKTIPKEQILRQYLP